MSINTNNTNKGFYWDTEKWEITLTQPKGSNVKIPTIIMLFTAPLMGALLVVFLPFLGFFLLSKHLIVTMYKSLGSVIVPRIAIGRAYFVNRKKK